MNPIQMIVQHLKQMHVSAEMLDELIKALAFVLKHPERYGELLQSAIQRGLIQEGDVPDQFDPQLVTSLLQGLSAARNELAQNPPQEYAHGGLARAGRGGDTMLAHINPREAEILRRMGGSDTVNPTTGLREFKGGGGWLAPVLTLATMAFAPGLGAAIGGALGAEGIAAPMLGGAILGGTTSAISGGNPIYGALGGGLGGAIAGNLGDLGAGIEGDVLDKAAGVTDWGTPFGDKVTSGLSGTFGTEAGEAAGDTLGKGISGGLQTSFDSLPQATMPDIQNYAGDFVGNGVNGGLPDPNFNPSWSDTVNSTVRDVKNAYMENVPQWADTGIRAGATGLKVANAVGSIANAMNPQEYGQRVAQQQMQQPGYSPLYSPVATNKTFGQKNLQGMRAKTGGLATFNRAKG